MRTSVRFLCQLAILLAGVLLVGQIAAYGQTALEQSPLRLRADSLRKAGRSEEALAWLAAEKETLERQGGRQTPGYVAVLWTTGLQYFRRYQFEPALENLHAALDLHRLIAPEDRENEIVLQNSLADCYEVSDPQKAIPLYEQNLALRLRVHGDNSRSAAKGYYELALIYAIVGNFEKGSAFGQKAIRCLKNAGLTQDPDYGGYHQVLGLIHQGEGDYPLALAYYSQALPLIQASLGEHLETAKCLSTIGEVYAELGDFAKALEYQLASAAMFEKLDAAEGRYLPSCYLYLANTCNLAGQPLRAIEHLRRVQAFGRGKPLAARVALVFSDAYRLLGDYPQALAYADSAVLALKTARGASPNALCRALLTKARLLTLSNRAADPELEQAGQLVNAALDTLSAAMAAFPTGRNKLALYREALKIFDLAISINLQLFEHTGAQSWLNLAFELSEKSKGLLLYQQLLENKYRRRHAVPLAGAEQALREQITALKKQLFELDQPAKSAQKDSLQEQLFALENQYGQIRQDIQSVYRDYFAGPDTFPSVPIHALRAGLAANEGLLEFFAGDSTLTAFLLLRDTLICRRLGRKKTVEEDIALFRDAVGRYFLAAEKTPALYQRSAEDFAESAYALHQKLLAPFAGLLPERLTIVPDGVLAYLPFEALLTQKPERPHRFHQHAYLLRSHTLRYACSAALLWEMRQIPLAEAPLAQAPLFALAPFYDGSTPYRDSLLAWNRREDSGNLSPLPFSGEEVYKIAALTGGELLSGAATTKNTFVRRAPNYRVLHLATHARANDMAGDYSFLAFSPDPAHPGGERLYVSEIYGLQLSAELVTLSACETGMGRLYRGEGIISVARAFASAGARSIVQSQWAVSDAQTRRLMELFYQNLIDGRDKDAALRRAKQAYLEKYPGEAAHPYFWAGFILIGDSAPLSVFKK